MEKKTLTGLVLDEQVELSLTEICRTCSTSTEWIIELVEEGVIEPTSPETMSSSTPGDEPTQWRFAGTCVQKVHTAVRLRRDLDINPAGIALALDLLDEIETLRARLRQFDAIGDG